MIVDTRKMIIVSHFNYIFIPDDIFLGPQTKRHSAAPDDDSKQVERS